MTVSLHAASIVRNALSIQNRISVCVLILTLRGGDRGGLEGNDKSSFHTCSDITLSAPTSMTAQNFWNIDDTSLASTTNIRFPFFVVVLFSWKYPLVYFGTGGRINTWTQITILPGNTCKNSCVYHWNHSVNFFPPTWHYNVSRFWSLFVFNNSIFHGYIQ